MSSKGNCPIFLSTKAYMRVRNRNFSKSRIVCTWGSTRPTGRYNNSDAWIVVEDNGVRSQTCDAKAMLSCIMLKCALYFIRPSTHPPIRPNNTRVIYFCSSKQYMMQGSVILRPSSKEAPTHLLNPTISN